MSNPNVTEEKEAVKVSEETADIAKKASKNKKMLEPTQIIAVPHETGEAIEAILFAAGHAVPYTVLARVLELPLAKTKQLVYSYACAYHEGDMPRGIMLLTFDDACQLCTKQQYLPLIRDALGIRHNGNLSNSSIETLAIIAYNQPVTRSYVDTVRGVDSSYAVGSLLERGMIESKGRLDAPGRPMLYGTTPDFLRCFGLSSLADLPGVSSDEAAEILAKISHQMSMDIETDKNQISMDGEIAAEEDERQPDKTAAAIGETPEEITE